MTLFDASPTTGESAPDQPTPDEPEPAQCRLLVAYDGTAFHGFAAQRDQRTVAGELVGALTKILRTDTVELACAGRTDAGVHAWGQVVSFPAPVDLDLHRLRASVNGM